jgi:hypothetical protein
MAADQRVCVDNKLGGGAQNVAKKGGQIQSVFPSDQMRKVSLSAITPKVG